MPSVADVMQTTVISIAPDASARELARLLREEHISGVPVRDSSGRVLGVVSASDLVRLAADAGDAVQPWQPSAAEPDDTENETAAWSWFVAEEPPPRFFDLTEAHGPDLDAYTVRDLMTPVPYTVPLHASIAELAALLLHHRIHRAIVLDGDRLAGIATTLDVLRSIAAPETESA